MTKEEFLKKFIEEDLVRWLSTTPQRPTSFLLSVEEWAKDRWNKEYAAREDQETRELLDEDWDRAPDAEDPGTVGLRNAEH